MNKIVQFKKKRINSKKYILLFLMFSVFSSQIAFADNSSPVGVNVELIINQKTVNLNFRNRPIQDILTEIKKQSGIGFAITETVKKELKSLSVNVKNTTVDQALISVLKDTDYEYVISNNQIVLKKKDIKDSKSSQVSPQIANEKLTVKGKIINKYKKPIPGATILVLGSPNGAIADDLGNFTLNNVMQGQEIEITYVGMVTQKHKITKSEKNYNYIVEMEEDVLAVEDVVVTGIVNRRAGSFTGASTTVKKEDLQRVGSVNVFQALKNLDPSLMILDNMEFGSDPNKNPKMALRGVSSFDIAGGDDFDLKGTYGSDPNAPLFVLDGFPVSIQKVMDLDMNRVESITILKDASAKALYGSKAANGVIVIEMARSKYTELRISYTGSLDIQAPDLSSYNLCNAREKLELEVDAGRYFDKNISTLYNLQREYNQILSAVVSGIDTDWLAKPLRNGIGTKHGISFDVGSDRLSLIGGFSYNKILGTMKGSDRTTYSGDIKVDYRYKNLRISNKLTIDSNVANDSPYGSFHEYAAINPYLSPVDEAGNIVQNANIIPGASNFIANPLYNATLNTKLQNKYIEFRYDANLIWDITKEFKATGRFSIAEKRVKSDEFYPANHLKFRNFSDADKFRKGNYKINEGEDKQMSGEFQLEYRKYFLEKHYVSGLLGYNISENSYEEIAYNAEGFPNDKMNDMIFAKQYAKDGKPTGRESTIRDIGVYGQLNYSYEDKYMIDASYRTSASSQYGAESRWGEFWSVGIGWNLHKEKWLNSDVIDELKLRGSVGYTGAQSSDAYASLATYSYILDQTYQGFLGSTLMGMRNDNLRWEDKIDYNGGINFSLKRGLISFKFDYYKGISQNKVLAIDLPRYTGFKTYSENIGEVINRGFDFSGTTRVWRRDQTRSSLSLTFAISHNKNEIRNVSQSLKSYNDKQAANAGDDLNNKPVMKYQDGESIDAIWAVRSLGIDPTDGREIYLDRFGKITKQYYASNLVSCGNSLPKFRGRTGMTFIHKGFEATLNFNFKWGGQLYNETLATKVENADVKTGNVDRRVYDGRWRKPGDVKPYKTLGNKWVQEPGETGDYIDLKTQATSRFVMDNNEFSLGAVSVNYDFYRYEFIKKLGMSRLRVGFNMNEVFMLSSIKVERGTSYPFARTFSFSLNATF